MQRNNIDEDRKIDEEGKTGEDIKIDEDVKPSDGEVPKKKVLDNKMDMKSDKSSEAVEFTRRAGAAPGRDGFARVG